MATISPIRAIIEGLTKNINEIKYVDSQRAVHNIKSVFYGPMLIWPDEYRCSIEPIITSSNLNPTNTSTNIQWRVTIYYPGTDRIVWGPSTIKSNGVRNVKIYVRKSANDAWVEVTDNSSTYSGNNTINGTWSFTSKETNGLGSSGYTYPSSDGPWYYKIYCEVPYTVNNKEYVGVYVNDNTNVTIAQNSPTLYTDTWIDKTIFCRYNNDYDITQANPVPYTGGTVIYGWGGREQTVFKFTSNSQYTYWTTNFYLTASLPSNQTMASLGSLYHINVGENTSTSPRSVVLTLTYYSTNTANATATYTIYQAGKPQEQNP